MKWYCPRDSPYSNGAIYLYSIHTDLSRFHKTARLYPVHRQYLLDVPLYLKYAYNSHEVLPASTVNVVPVIKEALSLSKYKTIFATSVAFTSCPSGLLRIID